VVIVLFKGEIVDGASDVREICRAAWKELPFDKRWFGKKVRRRPTDEGKVCSRDRDAEGVLGGCHEFGRAGAVMGSSRMDAILNHKGGAFYSSQSHTGTAKKCIATQRLDKPFWQDSDKGGNQGALYYAFNSTPFDLTLCHQSLVTLLVSSILWLTRTRKLNTGNGEQGILPSLDRPFNLSSREDVCDI
jgi:hypothetical protein